MMRAAQIVAMILVFASVAGAVLAAPVDDGFPDPKPCELLSNLDLEPLLFSGVGGVLDSGSDRPADGEWRCRWEAHPKNRSADAVPIVAMLAFYHMANPAKAQAQLDREPHVDSRPSMAITAGGDDALVRPTTTSVVARHGQNIAIIDAVAANLANPDQVEVRYLLDSLALKAAGAAVKPPPWARPGQVAAWKPIDGGRGAVEGWTPSPYGPSSSAVVLEPLAHIMATVARWRFGLEFVLAPLASVLIIFGGGLAKRLSSAASVDGGREGAPRWPAWIGGLLIAVMVGAPLFGTSIANALIDRFGVAGAAAVTGSFATSTQYNRHDVVGYDIMIRTADGRAVSGQFRTDDFNVLPSGNSVSYPGPGDVFTVRYLPHFPADFVIKADDASPWARGLACARLSAWRQESQRRSGFAPEDAGLRAELSRAEAAEQGAACDAVRGQSAAR